MNLEKVSSHIVSWLKDYLAQSGSQGFVVGVSGGVDSALVSSLVAQTGCPLICVEMPIHQVENQVSRAKRHINFLKEGFPGVTSVEVDLTQNFESFIKAMPEAPSSDLKELSLINTRARLRMSTLYYFAGLHRYLVVGTGNKVEDFGVGFFTKYGDGGVDLSPIADLTKSEVFALARHLGVVDAILDAAPTDGLWGDDRSDEDQLGATYPELEWAMEQYADNRKISDFRGREQEIFEIYAKLHRSNLHKMTAIPVCYISDDLRI